MVRLEDDLLADVLAEKETDQGRCEYACREHFPFGQLVGCEAVGDDESLPTWDAGQVAVTVSCEIEITFEQTCPPL